MIEYEEGPNIPVFICDPNAPKEDRIKRMNQNISTLVTIAEQETASIPLVAHTSSRGLSSSELKALREKLMQAIGINFLDASPFAEESGSQQEENKAGFDVLSFLFMIALPRKG